MKFALIQLNEQKSFYCVIEYQDSLESLITAHELIHAQIRKTTLELLYDSFTLPKDSFLWVTASGKIISLAAHWKHVKLDDTIHITNSTDCVALISCAATRKFTLVAGAKIVENLSAHHALHLLYELQKTPYNKEKSNHVTQNSLPTYNDTHFS
jgi:hypothetical protein